MEQPIPCQPKPPEGFMAGVMWSMASDQSVTTMSCNTETQSSLCQGCSSGLLLSCPHALETTAAGESVMLPFPEFCTIEIKQWSFLQISSPGICVGTTSISLKDLRGNEFWELGDFPFFPYFLSICFLICTSVCRISCGSVFNSFG